MLLGRLMHRLSGSTTMTHDESTFVVLGLAGSLRMASMNRGLLLAAQVVAPPGIRVDIADIAALPHYNADHDGDAAPAVVVAFREQMRASHALLIATPEYNHSIPGVLKNALDWAGSSRAKPSPSLRGNPVAILGAAPGKSGTIRAQLALKTTLAACRCNILMGHDTFLQNAAGCFDAGGRVTDPAVKQDVLEILVALKAWAKSVASLNG
jgi:chromate reductase